MAATLRALDGYIYGFALTQMNLPVRGPRTDVAVVAESMVQPFEPGDTQLVAFITEHAMQPGYDLADEFGYGLDLILDGLEGRGFLSASGPMPAVTPSGTCGWRSPRRRPSEQPARPAAGAAASHPPMRPAVPGRLVA